MHFIHDIRASSENERQATSEAARAILAVLGTIPEDRLKQEIPAMAPRGLAVRYEDLPVTTAIHYAAKWASKNHMLSAAGDLLLAWLRYYDDTSIMHRIHARNGAIGGRYFPKLDPMDAIRTLLTSLIHLPPEDVAPAAKAA